MLKQNRPGRNYPKRDGVSAIRIIVVVVLLAVIGAFGFDLFQASQRDKAMEALAAMDINPVRDPNNELRVMEKPDFTKPAAKRKEIHEKVFGGAEPTAATKDGALMYKESWAYPGVFTTYVVDVTYNLDANAIDEASLKAKKVSDPQYYLLMKETRNISRFDPEPLIEVDDPMFNKLPNFEPKSVVGEGGGGGGGGSRGQNRNQGDAAGSGDAGSGDAGSGDAGSGDAGTGDAGTGDAGSGDAGSGDAGSGDAGSGDAGTGDANKGDGSDDTPIKAPPAGDAGSGDAGSGDAGTGDAGNGGGL